MQEFILPLPETGQMLLLEVFFFKIKSWFCQLCFYDCYVIFVIILFNSILS